MKQLKLTSYLCINPQNDILMLLRQLPQTHQQLRRRFLLNLHLKFTPYKQAETLTKQRSKPVANLFRQSLERHLDVHNAKIPHHGNRIRLAVNPPYLRERQPDLRPVLDSLVHMTQNLENLAMESRKGLGLGFWRNPRIWGDFTSLRMDWEEEEREEME